jgi:DNA primase
MASFPDRFVDEVRERSDIVDLVSQYVPLKAAGKNLKGLCPFHAEKTPSFNVSREKQIFHCFGCGQGGDAFQFLMLYERMTFPEAIAHLANRAGLSLPRSRGGVSTEDRTDLLALHDEAARFFQSQLKSEAGRSALDYLRNRGLNEETIDRQGLGYAPDGWSRLLDHLTRRGAKPERVALAGLAVARQTGSGYYDRFRGRVMIPIRNESGRVVAFGGRLLGAGEPKYLNSPETPIYSKSRTLFGFDQAREAIRRENVAILMEGYLDSIQATQSGFGNTVACCGTALTSQQARLLRRYADEVVVSFDPDVAGRAATGRSIDLLVEESFKVSVLELPPGEDPDSFIRNRGAAAFTEALAARLPFVEYILRRAASRHDVRSPRGKRGFLDEVMPTLARIPDEVERAGYVDLLGRHAQIGNDVVLNELRRQVVARRSRAELPADMGERVTDAERDLVLWAFAAPEETIAVLEALDEEDLTGLATAAVLRAMREAAKTGGISTDRVLGRLTHPADRRILTTLAARPDPVNPRQSPRDCFNSLRRERLKRELGRLQRQLEQERMDDDTYARISAAKLDIRRQMEVLI